MRKKKQKNRVINIKAQTLCCCLLFVVCCLLFSNQKTIRNNNNNKNPSDKRNQKSPENNINMTTLTTPTPTWPTSTTWTNFNNFKEEEETSAPTSTRLQKKQLQKEIMAGKLRKLRHLLSSHHHRSSMSYNEPDKRYGATPLYYACQRGQLAEVKQLLKHKNINVNPVALCTGCAFMVVDNSRVPSTTYRAPLHIASARGHLQIVAELLAHPDIDVNLVVNNFTPLHAAIMNGQLKVVEMLLADSRIDVNVKNNQGNTAMHLCCANGAHDALGLILTSSPHSQADTNITNDEGFIPYLVAMVNNENKIAQHLLGFLRTGVWWTLLMLMFGVDVDITLDWCSGVFHRFTMPLSHHALRLSSPYSTALCIFNGKLVQL
jgi:ankyrin repeat protein